MNRDEHNRDFFFLQLWTRIIEVGGESGQCVYEEEGGGREIAGNIFLLTSSVHNFLLVVSRFTKSSFIIPKSILSSFAVFISSFDRTLSI